MSYTSYLRFRNMLAILGTALFLSSAAQQGQVPMSNELHELHGSTPYEFGSTMHTAIKPWHWREVDRLLDTDTSYHRPTSFSSLLERWSQRRDTVLPGKAAWRGGPLLDASGGYDASDVSTVTYQFGAGFWAETDLGPKVTLHADAQGWMTQWAGYLDSLTEATQVTPGLGYARNSATPYLHYDWNASLNYAPGKFFNLTLGRGRNHFGEGHRSLFLSNNAYSYPYLKVSTKVWHIQYVNLFTVMSDIRGADGDFTDYHTKYASFHYLSWNASRRLNLAIFEGIVWSSGDSLYPRGFDINYLNPVIFYRPTEFAQGSPDNALLGFAINVTVGRKSKIYTQLMLDEFLLREVRGGTGWFGNKQAFQIGFIARDALRQKGLNLRTEVNYVRPFMYTHSDSRQNYAHHGQPLAHPYGSNFVEWLTKVTVRKGRWNFSEHFSLAVMGEDTSDFSWGNSIFRPESDRIPRDVDGRPTNFGFYLTDPSSATVIFNELKASYLLDPESGISIEAAYVLRSRVSDLVDDQLTNWFRLGIVSYFRDRSHDQEVRYALP